MCVRTKIKNIKDTYEYRFNVKLKHFTVTTISMHALTRDKRQARNKRTCLTNGDMW